MKFEDSKFGDEVDDEPSPKTLAMMELQRSYFRAVIGPLVSKASGPAGGMTQEAREHVCEQAWELAEVAMQWDRAALDHLLDLEEAEAERRLKAGWKASPVHDGA